MSSRFFCTPNLTRQHALSFISLVAKLFFAETEGVRLFSGSQKGSVSVSDYATLIVH